MSRKQLPARLLLPKTILTPLWVRELGIERKGLRAHATGQLVQWSWGNFNSVARGVLVHGMTRILRLISIVEPGKEYKISFSPNRPMPWYLIWVLVHAGKGRVVKDISGADVHFFFEDVTYAKHFLPANSRLRLTINAGCGDISKRRVQNVFAQVFGYSLAIDPASYRGLAVEKSDENGAHDGREVMCPCKPVAGKVYEKLIVNSDNGAIVVDYRAPTIGGEFSLVFVKHRPVSQRFSNSNTHVRLADPASLFSPEERVLVSRFCAAMSLEFGGIDILRDRQDGRLYIVDVNKTDMGPPTALPMIQQWKSIQILAREFRKYVVLGKPQS